MIEKTTLVEKLNEENKLVKKDVPNNLLSIYLNNGWKVSQKIVEIKPEVKIIEKEIKKLENDKY